MKFDIVVYGATGFTGRLVAEYLAQQRKAGTKVRFALAGRDQARLDAVCAEVASVAGPGAEAVPTILASSNDTASITDMVKQTKVLLSTAGPFSEYVS